MVIALIRLMGIRSTSQMNNFDWIVTVAIGSIFASATILRETNLWEAVFGILLLLVLQFLVTKAQTKWEFSRVLLKATPQLLVFEGEFIDENMLQERVVEGEVFTALRSCGYKSIEDVYAVVLETNGRMSVIPNENNDTIGFSLSDVGGLPKGLKEDLENRGLEEE